MALNIIFSLLQIICHVFRSDAIKNSPLEHIFEMENLLCNAFYRISLHGTKRRLSSKVDSLEMVISKTAAENKWMFPTYYAYRLLAYLHIGYLMDFFMEGWLNYQGLITRPC